MSRSTQFGLALLLTGLVACGDSGGGGGSAEGGAGQGGAAVSSTSTSNASGGAGQGGAGQGAGGQGGGVVDTSLDALLAALRADRDGTLLAESYARGWPVLVDEGRVVVSTDPALDLVAGDHDAWAGTATIADQGFSYLVLPDVAGAAYKLTDGADYVADPWARAYAYDEFGEISMVPPATAHLERYFEVGSTLVEPRTVRVWLPEGTATHVLYAHDGQNLFDPDAFFGGWQLQTSAPAGMMIVGIDNTAARFEEYTHVADDFGNGVVGGEADDYAAFLADVVRPLVADQYGEPAKVGTMGSSLGGLVSLHLGLSQPGEWDFVASLSGTVGWGSIGPDTNDTIIDRFAAAGHQPFTVYLDSGGNGTTCADADADGIDDDDDGATDNYCENLQLRDLLDAEGWEFDVDLHHWHEPEAPHDEGAWAARVFRPLDIFADM